MKKRFFILIFLILPTLIYSSCQDESFGFTKEDIYRGAYERNFVNFYGPISPLETWDFSQFGNNNKSLQTRSSLTPGDDWYHVEKGTQSWIDEILHEGRNNASLLRSFGFFLDQNAIEIIPLTQSGAANVDWELHAKLVTPNGNNDFLLYKKSQADQIQVMTQEMVCQDCLGSGVVTGRGEVHCKECNGKKYKFVGSRSATCPSCNGTKKEVVQCDYCYGKGYYRFCRNCNGAGNIFDNYSVTWKGCASCGGTGSLFIGSINSGGTLVNGTGVTSCTKCKGSKQIEQLCTECYGKQLYQCDGCQGEGLSKNCPSCQGSGVMDNTKWRALGKNENTELASVIRSKPILLDPAVFDKWADRNILFFYIKVNKGVSNYVTTGISLTSTEQKMVLLKCPHPTNIDPSYSVWLAGCEEQNLGSVDADFNDLTFLIVCHNPNPKVEYVETDKTFHSLIEKRYMIEDLGSVSDWDFNDVVLDVSEYCNNKIYSDNLGDPKQTRKTSVVIRHLCGTIPVQIKVGNSTLPKITDPTNHDQTLRELLARCSNPVEYKDGKPGWDPAWATDIEGWIPSSNNITVSVWKDGLRKDCWHSEFPAMGAVPYIFATDLTTPWTEEGRNFPFPSSKD